MTTFVADSAPNETVQGTSANFTYRRFGPRGGVPLVLLHRFRGTIDWWDPEFLEYLAKDHDVILFDNIGVGYSSGEPLTTVEDYADGAAEFIGMLKLEQVDLLGWSLGGVISQLVVFRHPNLVRRLIVAGSQPPGSVPEVRATNPPEVEAIMVKDEASDEDLKFLFYPRTKEGVAAGDRHLRNINTRGVPKLASSETAAGQFQAIGALFSQPFEPVLEQLSKITQPVLYANGVHDVMIDSRASVVAVENLPNATLLLYSDAGHAFLFQHDAEFAEQVRLFLAA
ncbi:alpha/beta hydrolase [Arthrobacter sp. NPDC080031]|uniref:alpha/beta fold hydrolase n=1 Tax=Arthrobacter sp. NPDC080031 TaxID=3155918 RepID=UPI003450D6B8